LRESRERAVAKRRGEKPPDYTPISAVKEEASATSTETPATPADTAAPAPATTTDAAGSEPASPQKPKQKTSEDSERRFQELLEDRGRLKQKVETMEEQLRQLTAADDPGSQPDSETAEERAPRMDDLDDNGRPLYKTLGEWHDAVRVYDREQILKEVRAEQTKSEETARQTEAQRVLNTGWRQKVAEASKKLPDYEAVALNPNLPIKQGSLVEAFVLDSDHGAHVLYELGKNPEELKRIAAIVNPQRQFRELLKIEAKFSTSAPAAAAAPKKVTSAPAPPAEIGGSGSVPPDEREQAAKDSESDPAAVRRFIAADTRKRMARRKGL
jgi:hypothetical protein